MLRLLLKITTLLMLRLSLDTTTLLRLLLLVGVTTFRLELAATTALLLATTPALLDTTRLEEEAGEGLTLLGAKELGLTLLGGTLLATTDLLILGVTEYVPLLHSNRITRSFA